MKRKKYWVMVGYCVMNEYGQVTSYFMTRQQAEKEAEKSEEKEEYRNIKLKNKELQ